MVANNKYVKRMKCVTDSFRIKRDWINRFRPVLLTISQSLWSEHSMHICMKNFNKTGTAIL